MELETWTDRCLSLGDCLVLCCNKEGPGDDVPFICVKQASLHLLGMNTCLAMPCVMSMEEKLFRNPAALCCIAIEVVKGITQLATPSSTGD